MKTLRTSGAALLGAALFVSHSALAQQAPAPAPAAPAAKPAPSIPASGEAADQALLASPRHGEWADVPLPNSETKIRTWVSYPERAGKAPVLIVIHEIFGLTPWVRAVADQAAAEGFIAVAPDLLSGKGPNGGGTESFAGDAVREAIRGLSNDEVTTRLDAVRAWALARPAAGVTSATMGFCWGGSASFNYATRQPALNAAVVFYGTGPTDEAAIGRIGAPVLGFYGGDDARVTSTVEATSKAMAAKQKSFTSRVYEGAGHGFLRQQDGRDGANLRAAQQSWAESISFLRNRLEPVAAPAAAASAPANAGGNATRQSAVVPASASLDCH